MVANVPPNCLIAGAAGQCAGWACGASRRRAPTPARRHYSAPRQLCRTMPAYPDPAFLWGIGPFLIFQARNSLRQCFTALRGQPVGCPLADAANQKSSSPRTIGVLRVSSRPSVEKSSSPRTKQARQLQQDASRRRLGRFLARRLAPGHPVADARLGDYVDGVVRVVAQFPAQPLDHRAD